MLRLLASTPTMHRRIKRSIVSIRWPCQGTQEQIPLYRGITTSTYSLTCSEIKRVSTAALSSISSRNFVTKGDGKSGEGVVESSSSSSGTTTIPPSFSVGGNNSRRSRVRRRLAANANTKEIPSYKEFVHRFTVVSLYRNFLKGIRSLDDDTNDSDRNTNMIATDGSSKSSSPSSSLKDELKLQVQREFRAYKNESDPYQIQRVITDGQRRYEELKQMVPEVPHQEDLDEDSWLNTNDPEDPRGRVGEGWPWEQ